METTFRLPNGSVLSMQREVMPQWSLLDDTEYVTDWTWTDANGHEHHIANKKPTDAEWVVTATYWCEDCRDEHTDEELRCSLCGEPLPEIPTHVTRPASQPFYITGPIDYSLISPDGRIERLTEAEFTAALEQARSSSGAE